MVSSSEIPVSQQLFIPFKPSSLCLWAKLSSVVRPNPTRSTLIFLRSLIQKAYKLPKNRLKNRKIKKFRHTQTHTASAAVCPQMYKGRCWIFIAYFIHTPKKVLSFTTTKTN